MRALWVVGEPGVGKTTLVRALLGDRSLTIVESPKWTLAGEDFALAGHYKGDTFDGGDTVSHDVGPTLDYWEAKLLGREITIFDGDRFSDGNKKARIVKSAEAYILHLVAPEEVTAARREARREPDGKVQNATWVKGRKSKAANFASSFPEDRRLVLDSTLGPEALAEKVWAWLRGEKVESLVEKEESVLDLFG